MAKNSSAYELLKKLDEKKIVPTTIDLDAFSVWDMKKPKTIWTYRRSEEQIYRF